MPTEPSRYSVNGIAMIAVTDSVSPYPSSSLTLPPCAATSASKRSFTGRGNVSAPEKHARRQDKSLFANDGSFVSAAYNVGTPTSRFGRALFEQFRHDLGGELRHQDRLGAGQKRGIHAHAEAEAMEDRQDREDRIAGPHATPGRGLHALLR